MKTVDLGPFTEREVFELLKDCVSNLSIERVCEALREVLSLSDQEEVSLQLEPKE